MYDPPALSSFKLNANFNPHCRLLKIFSLPLILGANIDDIRKSWGRVNLMRMKNDLPPLYVYDCANLNKMAPFYFSSTFNLNVASVSV